MNLLLHAGRLVSAFNERIGRSVAWLALALVAVELAIVVMRYVFGLASLIMRESTLYLYAVLFLLAAGYAFRHDAHVRIDIVYERLGARGRAAVDLFGTVAFLVPFCGLIIWTSVPFVGNSWASLEGSVEGTGIPAVFLLKTVIPVFAVLLLLQGFANATRALATLLGVAADDAQVGR